MLSAQNQVRKRRFPKEGGITGILALFSILFIRDRFVFWPVSGFERVLPIFVKYCLLASSMILELCAIIFSISTSLLSTISKTYGYYKEVDLTNHPD